MDRLEALEKKVKQAAEQLIALREDRQRLQAELSFLQEENKRTKNLVRENERWQEEKKTLTHRIERVLKKINALKI